MTANCTIYWYFFGSGQLIDIFLQFQKSRSLLCFSSKFTTCLTDQLNARKPLMWEKK